MRKLGDLGELRSRPHLILHRNRGYLKTIDSPTSQGKIFKSLERERNAAAA